jgi:hypothetical protein
MFPSTVSKVSLSASVWPFHTAELIQKYPAAKSRYENFLKMFAPAPA